MAGNPFIEHQKDISICIFKNFFRKEIHEELFLQLLSSQDKMVFKLGIQDRCFMKIMFAKII